MKQHIELTEYERNYIELTEYDSNGRIVIFVDSIQGLYRVHDCDYRKDFTEVLISGYTFAVNEPIDEILERMKSGQGHLDGIEVGYEKAMQKINKIRAGIEQIADEEQRYNEKWATGLRYAVKIIDKYMTEENGGEEV